MIQVRVTNDRAVLVKLDETQTATKRSITSGIRGAIIHLETVLKRDVLSGQILHRRTGNLSRAVTHEMETPQRGVVGVGKEAPYAQALNDGARPHIIEAKPGKVLAFVPGGTAAAIRTSGFVTTAKQRRARMKENTVFAQRVHHPGNPPYRFMEIGLKMATPEIEKIITSRLAAAIEKGRDG